MTLPIVFVLDASGSMQGEKIFAVNSAINDFKNVFLSICTDLNVVVGVISFSSGFEWQTDGLIKIEDFEYKPLFADGLTDIGSAIEELGRRLTKDDLLLNIAEPISKPVIAILSDGYPTDQWEDKLKIAEANKWFSNSIRLSIGVGKDVDENALKRFSASKNDIAFFQAEDPIEIIDYITSIFYFSIIDGYSDVSESVESKTKRIVDRVYPESKRVHEMFFGHTSNSDATESLLKDVENWNEGDEWE